MFSYQPPARPPSTLDSKLYARVQNLEAASRDDAVKLSAAGASRAVVEYATLAANCLLSLRIASETHCNTGAYARRQEGSWARRACAHPLGSDEALYCTAVSVIFDDLAVKCGDIGEEIEEDEDVPEYKPIYVPTEVPVPA